MSTQNKPIFLVSGATGAQGGSVVRSLLKSGKYHIRGMTRNINDERAKRLRDQGVEMIECNFTRPEQLRNALKGVEIFFGLTNFWDPETMGKECEIGCQFVDVAKEMGVKHFIWSSLPNVEKLSGGKLKVPHFTDKAKVGEYALKTIPTTLVSPACYYQNFTNGMFPCKKESDGTWVFTLPKISNLSGIDINDMGDAVLNIAEHRQEMIGKCIPLAGETMSLNQYLDQMREICGHKVELKEVSFKEYGKLGFKGAPEMAEMFEWINSNGYFGPNADMSLCKRMCRLKPFKEFLQQTHKVNPK